jgi:GT2 family glycosyltransferase/glycosyltransferase involved in cell wall biosynthesis
VATVVVPIWGPSPDLERCLGALRTCTDLSRHRIVLVADGPLPPGPSQLAARLVGDLPGAVRLIERPASGGYPAAANSGLRVAEGDVALLNSDTEVTEGWLEKLGEAVRRRPGIASATPFSNNATLCSLPRPFAENAVPAGHTVASFGKLVEERSGRTSPEIPTGNGFCLYLRREAIEEVGLLDEDGFGAGYGEEVDWCLRASARDFTHVLDDATFVWHRGGGSFGREGVRRARKAERLLEKRHRGFLRRLARFMREDPLAPVRERVMAALQPARRAVGPGPRRVVHLVHGWPPYATGGTEVFARSIALSQAGRWDVAVYARLSDGGRSKGDAIELLDDGVRVRLVVNNFLQRDPFSRNALYDRALSTDFGKFLDETQPELLHVHHLAGHSATLPGVARRRGIPVVFQLQDWWPLCARVNFLHASGGVCTGPSTFKCARCKPLTSVPPRHLTNPALHALRAALMRRALKAERYLTGSRFLAQSWAEAGWLPGWSRLEVVSYGVPDLPARAIDERTPVLPLRFGFVGALMPHKGAHVAVEAFRGLPPESARLRIWGDPSGDPAYAEGLTAGREDSDVRLEGKFPETEKGRVFSEMDVLLVPSIGLESYGIVVDEAMAHGVPVIASRGGALPERFQESCGAYFQTGNAASLRAQIDALVARPETIMEWRRALPPVRTLAVAARRIEEIYGEILGARGTS